MLVLVRFVCFFYKNEVSDCDRLVVYNVEGFFSKITCHKVEQRLIWENEVPFVKH